MVRPPLPMPPGPAVGAAPGLPGPPRPRPVAGPGELLETTGLGDLDAFGHPGVFLRPGDWLFGRGARRVTTVLGSCVSLVAWAPRWRLGAMCHCLLPARPGLPEGQAGDPPDGRYGEEAAAWMARQFQRQGVAVAEVEVSLAGGACVNDASIGDANVAWAQRWLARHGWRVVQQDVGGRVVRRLVFNLQEGQLRIAHGGHLGNPGGPA